MEALKLKQIEQMSVFPAFPAPFVVFVEVELASDCERRTYEC